MKIHCWFEKLATRLFERAKHVKSTYSVNCIWYIIIFVCVYLLCAYVCIHCIYRRGTNISFSVCFILNVCAHMEYVCAHKAANCGKFCISKCFTFCDNSVFLVMIMFIFKARRSVYLRIIKFHFHVKWLHLCMYVYVCLYIFPYM